VDELSFASPGYHCSNSGRSVRSSRVCSNLKQQMCAAFPATVIGRYLRYLPEGPEEAAICVSPADTRVAASRLPEDSTAIRGIMVLLCLLIAMMTR
jgi:hypothetical protein